MPYTLLLADDSVTIQRVIELTFADEDVVVVAVSDGDQAIARLEASPPDIVLADIGMPGKNGYEVAQYIRQTPRLAHIPVVLLTGAFEPVDQARASAAGCDGVLAKPFEPQLVIGRVKELLARTPRPPAASAPEGTPPSIAPDELGAPPFADSPVAAPVADPGAPAALNDYFDRLDAAFSNLSSNTPAPAAAPASAATDIDWFTAASETPSADSLDFAAPPDLMEPADLSLTFAAPQPPASPAPAPVPPTPAEPLPPAPPAAVAIEAAAAPAPAAHVAALADFAPDTISAPVASRAPAEPSAPPEDFAAVETYAPSAAVAPVVPVAPLAAVAPVVPPAASADAASVAPSPAAAPARAAELPALADVFAALLAAEQHEAAPAAAPRWPGTAQAVAYDGGAPSSAAVDTDALADEITRRVLERLSDRVVRETVSEIVSTVAERLVREEIEKIKASLK